MAKKQRKDSIEGRVNKAARGSKQQLALVNKAIETIESKNFIVRWLSKDSLDILKRQKNYIKTQIKREQWFVYYKAVNWYPTSTEIVKANKALEKQLAAGEDIKYVSRKEEYHTANRPKKRKTRSDKWKTHNYKRRNTLLKAEEVMTVKPRRLFYD